MSRNLHQLAEARSLAIHRLVAGKIRERPELIDAAATRVRQWRERGDSSPYYIEAWLDLLSQPLDAICAVLEADNERSRELRQASPFAGVIDPKTRWSIWRTTKEQWDLDASSPRCS